MLSYTVLAFRQFLEQGAFDAITLLMALVRLLLGAAALVVVFYPPWLAGWLERQVDVMGALFETGYGNTSTSEKIRLIVLVTMVSLLLELVMIRWLASVFPVFSFFKNFTLLACFLGLGAGYAVAEKQPCAPALVLPMLALFAGVIVLLRYDVAADQVLFGALPMWEQTSVQLAMDAFDWTTLIRLSMPLYLLLGMSFILCACICYPIGQLCGKLLHSSNALKAYGLNLTGSILGVVALFVMSLFWLPPVVWFAVVRRILLFFVLSRDVRLPLGVASFCVLLTILSWPVQPETQRIYSPYQLLERTAKPDGLMQILSGGSIIKRSSIWRRASADMSPRRTAMCGPIMNFRSTSRKSPSASRLSAPAAATTWRRRCAWAAHTWMRSRSIRPSPISVRIIIPSIPTTIRASRLRSTMRAISSVLRSRNTT